METILQAQICIMCESTNVHYNQDANKFICDTCGQHMTAEQTGSKIIKVMVTTLLLFCICLLGKSQTTPILPGCHFSFYDSNILTNTQLDTIYNIETIRHKDSTLNYKKFIAKDSRDLMPDIDTIIDPLDSLDNLILSISRNLMHLEVLQAIGVVDDNLYYYDVESQIFKRKARQIEALPPISAVDTNFHFYYPRIKVTK